MGKEIRNENIDKEVLTNQELDNKILDNKILDNKILNKKELVSNKSIIDSDSLKSKSQKLTKKLGKILVVVIILTIIAASIKYRKSRVAWFQGIDVNIENYTKGPTVENSAGKMLCNLIGKEEKSGLEIFLIKLPESSESLDKQGQQITESTYNSAKLYNEEELSDVSYIKGVRVLNCDAYTWTYKRDWLNEYYVYFESNQNQKYLAKIYDIKEMTAKEITKELEIFSQIETK